MTTPQRWQEIDRIFAAALEREPARRAAFLDEACAGDELLRQEVESLLANDVPESLIGADAVMQATRLLEKRAGELTTDRIGRYQIIRSLGAGGMGRVYLGHDEQLNRPVAVKLLSNYDASEEERMRRFRQEALAASALNHPNILTIYEIGEFEGTNFITAEFVDGVTLRARMKAEALPLDVALDIAIQIASALSAAHAAGIIHRDIKPENVMVRADGLVKVLDFGIAKFTQAEGNEKKDQVETMPGAIIGTAAYMSPEQARGALIDRRSDIWSLGVVLYEMLTGEQPFTGETISDSIASILRSEVVPPSNLNHEVPPELETIIAKALSKKCEERYQNAKDLLIDLRELCKRLDFTVELQRTKYGVTPSNGVLSEQSAVAGGFALQIPSEGSVPYAVAKTRNSIAVLPFSNMSADAENEYFCDGLAEELLNALAKIDDVKVAARTSAFSFKSKTANISEIGRALSVNTILQGSVRKSHNRLRITVQLINVSDGYHLWSERYDREMKDIFDVQDEITLAVVDALKVKLLGEEKAAVLKRYTDNAEAYQLYLKGRYFWLKAVPEEFRKSRDYFQQAVDADPSYALGYCGLAGFYGFAAAVGISPPNEWWPRAEAALRKALELDDTLSEVHNLLAALKTVYYRDWVGAEREFRRAVELNPKLAEVHNIYSTYLVAMGRLDEAIAEGRRTLELDPLSLRYSRDLGNWFYHARRYDEAIRQCREALELDPDNASVYEVLGDAYEQKRMHGEAIAAWQRAMTFAGDEELAAILDNAYAESGFSGAVRAVTQKRLERLNERSNRGEYVPSIKYASAYVRLGDKEQAFQWLGKACEERNVYPLLINSDPFYDSLRPDRRFRDLLRRVGLTTNKSPQAEFTGEASEAQTALLAPATTADESVVDAENNQPLPKATIDVAAEPLRESQLDKNFARDNIKNYKRGLIIGVVLFLLAAIGFGYWFFANHSTKQIESIAVLPFVNESGNADVEYLSDGMTESLINSLSQLPHLSVKARSSVFRYKGKEVEPQRIASELSVQAILTGRVVQHGDDLTLYLSLVETRNGNQIWGQQYNRKLTDLVFLQQEISRDVSEKLRLKLTSEEQRRVAKRYTDSNEAYELYLKGRYFLSNPTETNLKKSIEYFQQAIDKDQNYALAYAGIGRAYQTLGGFLGFVSPGEAAPQGKAAIVKALSIDETLDDAHSTLADFTLTYDWDLPEAEREYKRTIELNPNNPSGHSGYGTYLEALGRFDEAVAERERSRQLDPVSAFRTADVGYPLVLRPTV